MALNPKNQQLAQDFNDLKARVKAEMQRRQGTNSLVSYADAEYDYTIVPAKGEQLRTEHVNKIITPMDAITPTGYEQFEIGDQAVSIADLETRMDAHETMSTAQGAATDCQGGCNGLCSSGCFSGCSGCTGCSGCGGSCSRNCTGNCDTECDGCDGCTGCDNCTGCGSGCATECEGCENCTGCGSGCASTCEGCVGGCWHDGCTSNCTAACRMDCENTCRGDCGSNCSESCSGGLYDQPDYQ